MSPGPPERQRRQVLAALGSTATAAIAGCLTFTDGETDADSPPVTDETETPTATPVTPPATPPDSFRQTAKFTKSDPSGQFGVAATVSGDGTTAIIGNWMDESDVEAPTGSAHVFSRSDEGWSRSTKLFSENREEHDGFGAPVAMSDDGTTAVIGAYSDTNSSAEHAGAAYVFSQSGEEWSRQAKLVPDDDDSRDFFGSAVALSGDGRTAIIGAALAGSAYVFSRADGGWSQQTKLTVADSNEFASFGSAVAVSDDGTTAVIGAYNETNSNGESAGAAYVFSQSDEGWSQQAKLRPDDGDSRDAFGTSVTIADNGEIAIITASGDEDPNGSDAGSAYVFSRSDGTWTQETKLVPDDGDSNDDFGVSVTVSVDGTVALIGAYFDEDPNGLRSGSAYVFSRSDDTWSQLAKLVPEDGDRRDRFGSDVAMSNDSTTLIITANPKDGPEGTKRTGSAYVFE
jgi:hypothetical protein